MFLGRGVVDSRVDTDGHNENVDQCPFQGRINGRCSDSMTAVPPAKAWSSGRPSRSGAKGRIRSPDLEFSLNFSELDGIIVICKQV
jgi:hypothetical protein